jgi:hypothetical protein
MILRHGRFLGPLAEAGVGTAIEEILLAPETEVGYGAGGARNWQWSSVLRRRRVGGTKRVVTAPGTRSAVY